MIKVSVSQDGYCLAEINCFIDYFTFLELYAG